MIDAGRRLFHPASFVLHLIACRTPADFAACAEFLDLALAYPIQLSSIPPGHRHLELVTSPPATILVVDDEDTFRSLVVRQLQGAGYKTMEARDGTEALGMFADSASEISAVLLDLVMPNTSGSEALSMLRYYSPGLPVVITSGYPPRDAASLAKTERGVGFLAKPFSAAALTAELARVMGETVPRARHSSPDRKRPIAAKAKTIRALLVEDNPDDQALTMRLLRSATDVDFDVEVVSRLADAIALLSAIKFDVMLVDLALPDSTNLDTLRELQQKAPEVAMIALTGSDNPQTERAAFAMGAQDYLIKGQDDAPILMRAIRHAMARKRLENEQTELTRQLRKALAELRTLHGLLPVCVNCKRVRDDDGYWEQIDLYIRDHTDAEVSHSICPPCTRSLYPELLS
jgi:CheY-like chemotaxis protein